MKHSILDFLGSSLVPVLGADVATGAAGNIHLGLVGIAALRAGPDQLAVILTNLDLAVEAAALAVVRLGVQFCIDDVIIDKLHQVQNRINVLLHIGHFHIGNGTAGRQGLELSLEAQLGKGIDMLADMDMIGIGDVILIVIPGIMPKRFCRHLANL